MRPEYTVLIYATESEEEPFNKWLKNFKNKNLQALIFQRLQRIKMGNFGDCKSLGNGLWEFRIHTGAGYRLYYARIEKSVILLLCGGDKRTQSRDIKSAKKYLEDYRRRMR